MAQKVNTESLKLKKRLNWNTNFCAHNYTDFFNLAQNIRTQLITNEQLMVLLNLSQNFLTLTKTSKLSCLYSEILNQKLFHYYTKLLCSISEKQSLPLFFVYQSEQIRLFQQILKIFVLNQQNLCYKMLEFDKKKSFSNNGRVDLTPSYLSPKLITQFINTQTDRISCASFTKVGFEKNLQKNIIFLANSLIANFNNNVTGLKLICVGKWKKSNTGRKQKFYVKYGRVRSSEISNKTLIHTVSQTTKYGVFTIRVWISHKSE